MTVLEIWNIVSPWLYGLLGWAYLSAFGPMSFNSVSFKVCLSTLFSDKEDRASALAESQASRNNRILNYRKTFGATLIKAHEQFLLASYLRRVKYKDSAWGVERDGKRLNITDSVEFIQMTNFVYDGKLIYDEDQGKLITPDGFSYFLYGDKCDVSARFETLKEKVFADVGARFDVKKTRKAAFKLGFIFAFAAWSSVLSVLFSNSGGAWMPVFNSLASILAAYLGVQIANTRIVITGDDVVLAKWNEMCFAEASKELGSSAEK